MLAPAALLMVRRRDAALRRSGIGTDGSRHASIGAVGMVVGTLPWIWLILTPLQGPTAVQPVPLRDLTDQLTGAPVTAFFQVVGNLLVLASFGFFAAARWRMPVPVIAALAAAGSMSLEGLQFAMATGRVCSVDDVLVNTAGAALAALASRRFWPRPRAGRPPDVAHPVPGRPG